MTRPSYAETAPVMSHHQSGETDYCPRPKGVWLDRRELEKPTHRSAAPPPAAAGGGATRSRPEFSDSEHDCGRSLLGCDKRSVGGNPFN